MGVTSKFLKWAVLPHWEKRRLVSPSFSYPNCRPRFQIFSYIKRPVIYIERDHFVSLNIFPRSFFCYFKFSNDIVLRCLAILRVDYFFFIDISFMIKLWSQARIFFILALRALIVSYCPATIVAKKKINNNNICGWHYYNFCFWVLWMT